MAEDIVNLRMAEHAAAPVVLVADIHRGGVFGQIVGTLECLDQRHRDMIHGFIVNRFRGDLALFGDGVRWIEQRTGKRVFGVLPWFNHIRIQSEDSVVIENPRKVYPGGGGETAIAVIRLPHISNFTDFEPLSAIQGLAVHFLEQTQELSGFRAVILPGSKNTCFDLDWLKSSGWAQAIQVYQGNGGRVLGICGGYQMLGRRVHDPEGLEGRPGATAGLGLLPVETVLRAPKTTTLTRFAWQDADGSGYEIHMGQTERQGGLPLFRVWERNGQPLSDDDGCATADQKTMGTYIHGLFDNPLIAARWLETLGVQGVQPQAAGGLAARDIEYERLADHFEAHADVPAIMNLIEWETRPE
jgi:adenosylcobyric acid synthase